MDHALFFKCLLQESSQTDDREVHDALQRLGMGDGNDQNAVNKNGTRNPEEPVAARLSVPGVLKPEAAAPITTGDSGHKKRKTTTYSARKAETRNLLQEMGMLQQQLKTLNTRGTSMDGDALLAASEGTNAQLREFIRAQQLSLAASQSVVSRLLNGEYSNPLSSSHIRLGTDWDDRCKTLLAIKDRMIRHACEYVNERSRFLDPLKRNASEERFETASGDFCCVQFDIYQFSNVTSVKQVYDALLSYFNNLEISVSERLGAITTRDDYDFVENNVANFRLLTSEFGVQIETHVVLFTKYCESHELFGGEPCGVVAVDRVEEDQLYPCKPQERMRRDITSSMVLRPHWREKGGGRHGEKEFVVSLSIGKFKKLHQSKCSFATPEAVEQMHESTRGWGGVMITTVSDILNQAPHL